MTATRATQQADDCPEEQRGQKGWTIGSVSGGVCMSQPMKEVREGEIASSSPVTSHCTGCRGDVLQREATFMKQAATGPTACKLLRQDVLGDGQLV
jgi:hypothetical protein